MYLVLTARGQRCAQPVSDHRQRGLIFLAVSFLTVATSLVAEHRLSSVWSSVVLAPGLSRVGSEVVAHSLVVPSEPCAIFPDQGLNLCPLHWQASF